MSNGPRASRPLFEYLGASDRNGEGPFVFTFQRAQCLAEAGAHHWFRKLRSKATKGEWDLLGDVTFHDLRPDSAHRAREAGWTIEEVAYYLGYVTKKGTAAIGTTARYAQVSREDVKEKLKDPRGCCLSRRWGMSYRICCFSFHRRQRLVLAQLLE